MTRLTTHPLSPVPARRLRPVTCTALLGVALAACTTPPAPAPGPRAEAQLQARSGSAVSGTVSFNQEGGRVRVVARVAGLTPNQEHGFHVHEKGDCSSADGLSTGGHFNPTGQPHGAPDRPHHGGDMPALKADAKGNAEATLMLDGVTLGTGPADLLGKAVIVHAKPDDYTTQPTGNAGGRVACGVIAAVGK